MGKKIYTLEDYAAIGRKVVEAQERRWAKIREYNETHAAEWKEKGKSLKNCRINLKISQNKAAEKMRCSFMIIRRLEAGLPVQNRDRTEAAYMMALKDIHHDRGKCLNILDEIEHEKNLEKDTKNLSKNCV